MTANLSQQVVSRRHRHFQYHAPTLHPQRGSINNHAIAAMLGLMGLVMCAALGFFYLHQILGNASQGSDIHTLQASLDQLREKQRQLELEGAELRSMRTIEQRVEKLNLVTTDQVAYLVSTPDRVALRSE